MILNMYGGTALNFKVAGGTAAPADAGENTLWINTATAVTGWSISETAPETPAAGMVWICTGPSGTAAFNALRKNAIVICPVSARQYVSGAWVEKDAKIYRNGAWVDWAKWLYQNGTWGNGTALTKGYTYGSPTLTYGSSSIKINCGTNNDTQYLYFPRMENLEGRSRLVLRFRSNAAYTSGHSEDWGAGVRIGVATGTDHNALAAQAKQYSLAADTTYTLEVDVSSLSGHYYVHLFFARGDGACSGSVNVDILEVYLV